MGHTVRLIAPQFVKPFVKSNKSDAANAEAICEAVQHPTSQIGSLPDLTIIWRRKSTLEKRDM